MIRAFTHPRRRPASPATAPGFTFIEVLFAIVILGIGSIMLAGMLPVAIKQSADTRNEITGRALCESAFAYVQAAVATGQYTLSDSALITVPGMAAGAYPNVGRVVPLTSAVLSTPAYIGTAAAPGPLYAMRDVTGGRIYGPDPRFQWTAFYGRDPNANTARLVVLSQRLQNVEATQRYDATTLTRPANDPLLMNAEILDGGALDPDRIALTGVGATAAQSIAAADSGAFVIVASQSAGTARDPARNNGRVFRLGIRRTDLETTPATTRIFDLQPGYDLPPADAGADRRFNTADDLADASLGAGTGTQVWIVGRGLRDPLSNYDATNNPPVGPVQDIAVYQVTVPVR